MLSGLLIYTFHIEFLYPLHLLRPWIGGVVVGSGGGAGCKSGEGWLRCGIVGLFLLHIVMILRKKEVHMYVSYAYFCPQLHSCTNGQMIK